MRIIVVIIIVIIVSSLVEERRVGVVEYLFGIWTHFFELLEEDFDVLVVALVLVHALLQDVSLYVYHVFFEIRVLLNFRREFILMTSFIVSKSFFISKFWVNFNWLSFFA